jgi:hypothetical protein
MNDFHKELLSEIIQTWNVEKIESYIVLLEQRSIDLNDWIKHLRTIRRKKTRKQPLDTGVRGGA